MNKPQYEPACRRMEWLDPFYKAVWEKAYADAIPISGTFELTPRCNFNCRMCYVHLPESEINHYGQELTAKEWIRIAEEAKRAGTTWLCITGGEPLMHPEFETIWKELSQMGFFITLQTNASLIKQYKKLFEKYPPRLCKITLYGSNNETYQKVCRVQKGFSEVDQGIQLLIEMGSSLEIVSTVINQNVGNVEGIIDYVSKNKLTWYPNINIRAADRGVDVDMKTLRISNSELRKENLSSQKGAVCEKKPCEYCRDYRLGYWIVWNGFMRFCSFMNGPDISIRGKTFLKCWEELISVQDSLEWPDECKCCDIKENCKRCPALFGIEENRLIIKEEYCIKRKEK